MPLNGYASAPDVSIFGLSKEFRQKSRETNDEVDTWLFESDDRKIIKVTRIRSAMNSDEADQYFQNKKNFIQSLYKVHIEPYFGKPDKDLQCVSRINLNPTPVANEVAKYVSYELGATEKLIYGTCSEDLEIYSSNLVFLYCKNIKTFFEIKSFTLKSKKLFFSPNLQSFCNFKIDKKR